jgi:hypothetical protein
MNQSDCIDKLHYFEEKKKGKGKNFDVLIG